MLAIDFRLTDLQRILQQSMRINDFKIELHLAFANARQIEQIINEPRLQLHVPVDHSQ